jgi:hypothetical protein
MRILRNYFYWTYERGSFHYDVMVTLILAFIFITPHLWNYKDKPSETVPLHKSQVLVTRDATGGFIYQVSAADVPSNAGDEQIRTALLRQISPIAGNITLDHYGAITDANGRLVAYKAWVKH